MNDGESRFRKIAFVLATAIIGLALAYCAHWAFSQLGPLEQHLVSSTTMTWVDAMTLSAAAPPDSSVAGDARCAQPAFRAAARMASGAGPFQTTCGIKPRAH